MAIRRMPLTLAGGALVLGCAVSAAVMAQPEQNPPPGCSAWNAGLPKEWQPWADTAGAVVAASAPVIDMSSAVHVGKKVSLTLSPAKIVHMQIESPDIDPPPNAHGGLLSLHVPADGIYWVAVSTGLWVDVVQGGKILESTAHGPGPHCASIGKTVQFHLKAGAATLQLSDNRGPHVDLMVTRAP